MMLRYVNEDAEEKNKSDNGASACSDFGKNSFMGPFYVFLLRS